VPVFKLGNAFVVEDEKEVEGEKEVWTRYQRGMGLEET
jgi:hypothetical protein